MARLTPEQIAGRIAAEGGSGQGLVIGTAIVLRETGGTGDTQAFRPASKNPGGGNDRGMWQFNDEAFPQISDGDAYDAKRATAWAARISRGFTDFGPWDIGPNAYSGVDKLDELRGSRYWQPAVNAATRPDTSLPAGSDTGGGDPIDVIAPNATADERRLIEAWGIEDNGWRIRSSGDGEAYTELTGDQYDAMTNAVNDHVPREGVPIRTGWLAQYKTALDIDADRQLGSVQKAAFADLFHARQNRFGGPDPGLLDQIGKTVVGGVSELNPIAGVTDTIGGFFATITNPTLWRRILIAAGGGLFIVLAVVLANSDRIVGSVT